MKEHSCRILRLSMTEDRIFEFGDRSVETSKVEKQRVEKKKLE